MKKEISENGEIKEKLFGWSSLILVGVFLIIGIVFYVSLGIIKSGSVIGLGNGAIALSPDGGNDFSFGFEELIFAIVFGLFMTGFLLWVKSMIVKNSYLGTIIGIVGSIIIGYGFYLRYKGPYSTGFMTATALVILIYIGMNFFRYRKQEVYDEEEE